jgi:hypothetical protein
MSFSKLPTLRIQETDLVLFIEDVEKGRPGAEEDSIRILVFLKVYDPVARTLQDAGKIYPTRYRILSSWSPEIKRLSCVMDPHWFQF